MNLNLTSTQIHMSRHIKFYFNKENLVNLGCTQTNHLSIPNTIVGSKEVRFRQVFTIQINCKQFISAFSDHIGQLFLISIQAENDYGLSKQSGPRYIRAGVYS